MNRELNSNLGDLSYLETSNKKDMVAATNELFWNQISSNISTGNFHAMYLQQNNKMTIVFYYCGSSDATANHGFWQLDDAYRPKSQYSGTCIAVTSSGQSDNVGLTIDVNGNVYHTSSTPRKSIFGIVSYDLW